MGVLFLNRKLIFFSVLALIWILLLLNVGLNIFSVIFGVIFSFAWGAGFVSWFTSRNQFKKDQYFANKYDEEYGSQK